MKKYRNLIKQQITLRPNEVYELRDTDAVLSLNAGKVFLHWYSSNGNLVSTATLDDTVLCSSPVRLVNGKDVSVIDIIEL